MATNAEWCIKQGYKFNDINVLYKKDNGVYAISIKKNGAYTCLGTIKKFCAIYAFMEWLDQEHVEPILDDVERKYLSAMIRPFRDEIRGIVKHNVPNGKYQWIDFIGKDEYAGFYLPNFKTGTMYKGMQVGREYKLEELGL